MYHLKTKQTIDSVTNFLNSVGDEKKRNDSFAILELMEKVTKLKPKMWGTSIVGFGDYHYKYDSGHEGDICLVGFSPRKQNLTLYLGLGAIDAENLLSKLGKHKTGKGCLYINKLEDVDTTVLKQIIKASFDALTKKHKPNN